MSSGLIVAVVLVAIVLVVAEWALSIGATIDALSWPQQVWAAAGCRKLVWVWQAVGVYVSVGLVYSGIYYVRIRPKLVAAQRALDEATFAYLDADHLCDGHGPAVQEQTSTDHTVKIRIAIGWRLAFLAIGIPSVVLWFSFRHSAHHGDLFILWEWPIIGVLQLAMFSWFGVNLTPTEAIVNSLRRRRVSWSRVQAVAQEPFLGGRRVVLWTDQGDRIPLRSPSVDFTSIGARKFERDFHTVGRWWLQHRGPNWQPRPQ